MKLQFKVIFLVITVLIAIGILSGGTLLFFQRKTDMQQFNQMALVLAGTVENSLEYSMQLKERQMTQATITHIVEGEMVRKIAILSSNGVITASTDVSEIGKMRTISGAYPEQQQGDSLALTSFTSAGELQVCMPILNKAECQVCHSPNQTTLGTVEVSLDTSSMDSQAKEETILFGVIGALTFLIIGGVLSLVVRSTVLRPLNGLVKTAQRLTQGDYTVRIQHDKDDEIGLLAHTFNEMAQSVEKHSRDLEASRQELAKWNIDLEQKIKERTEQLSALNAIITTVSQSLNLEWMLNAALTKILAVTNIEAGMIHLLDPGSGKLKISVHHGLSPECFQNIVRMNPGEGVARQVIQSGEAIVVAEPEDNSQIPAMIGERGRFPTYISLPLKSKNGVLGTLGLASHLPDKFKPGKIKLLQAMADAIGIAVENAAANKKLEELNKVREQLLGKLLSAQEEERRRIARELHDDASQALAGIILHLEDIIDSLPEKYHSIKQRLDTLKTQATLTLEGIRRMALDLRPSVLDDLGLHRAIDWYAKDYLGKRGINTRVEVLGSRIKLPSNIDTVLFRIIQEALTNIVRHADASQVNLRLQFYNHEAKVTVEDNGKGFNVEAALNSLNGQQSLGLHGMLERTTLLGGALTIQSQPGKGTCLMVTIPLLDIGVSCEEDKRVISR